MKIFLIVFILLSSLYAVNEENIEQTMKTKIDEVTMILKDKQVSKEEKAKKLFNKMDDVFDFETMAKISLGKTFSTLDKQKQSQYLEKFTTKLKNSYLDKMDLYTNEEIKITSLQKPQDNRIYLNTIIVGKDKDYDVTYKFYEKNNDWLIYDVSILGVSIVKTFVKQFSEYLAVHNIDELISSFDDK